MTMTVMILVTPKGGAMHELFVQQTGPRVVASNLNGNVL
jgi:hypothetical protein